MKRYYCPDLDSGRLDKDESHHCLNVIRQEVGDLCTIFNGKGLEWKSRITGTAKGLVTFEKVAGHQAPRPTDQVCLAQAVTKGKSMEFIIQKATELGVSEIYPLQSDRAVVHLAGEQAESRVQKWEQLTIEAAKQSGQNWLPTVHPPQKIRAFVEDNHGASLKLIASLQPEARPLKTVLREALPVLKDPRRILIMIGPEGDFTPAEIGEARGRGFLPVSLGKIVLRSETAAIFTLGAATYELMGE